MKKGDDPKGFAFSVKNEDVEPHDYSYIVETQDVTGCGTLTTGQANSWLRPSKGEFSLGAGNAMTLAQKVLFAIPQSAPPCTITYSLKIEQENEPFESGQIFVTIR